jgi:2-enoate reductase
MEFAIQASRRGHRVDLYEKTGELGGLFIAAAASECKEKDRALIEWYKRQLKASSVQVHMNTEIRDLKELDAEEIVLATGGTPKTLPVPGGDQTVTVAQALRNETQLGDRVVIIGGGLAGCELAYDLVCKGRHPSIVEMQDDLIKVLYVSAPNSMLMRDLLRFHKVPVYLESRTVEIRKDAVVIEGPEGKREIFADSVVNAIGFNPGSPLAPEKKNPHVHRIGDVENVSNLKNAIWGANDLVLKLSR